MKISIVTFSPTGGTLKCTTEIAASMGEIIQRIDLTDSNLCEMTVSNEADVVIIAVPSYGGRVPGLAAERLTKINGNNKSAVLLTVFGNRAFEDALVELQDIACRQRLSPIAAVSAIAQHCMDPKIATNRPDEADLAKLREFGGAVAAKVSEGVKNELYIPGNRPYKKTGVGMTPVTDKSCSACGVCAGRCPAQAISHIDPAKIDVMKCIGCMRCVAICPQKAKRLPSAKRLLVHTFLSATASKRKAVQLYI